MQAQETIQPNKMVNHFKMNIYWSYLRQGMFSWEIDKSSWLTFWCEYKNKNLSIYVNAI